MTKFETVIEILSDARDKIIGVFNTTEDENHRLKISSSIDKNIDYLTLVGGTNGMISSAKTVILGPATTIGGKKIEALKNSIDKDTLQPDKNDIEILREKIDAAYPDFINMDTAEIIESLDAKIILGIAKKAKVPKVSADTKITTDFIDQIKEAIKKKESK